VFPALVKPTELEFVALPLGGKRPPPPPPPGALSKCRVICCWVKSPNNIRNADGGGGGFQIPRREAGLFSDCSPPLSLAPGGSRALPSKKARSPGRGGRPPPFPGVVVFFFRERAGPFFPWECWPWVFCPPAGSPSALGFCRSPQYPGGIGSWPPSVRKILSGCWPPPGFAGAALPRPFLRVPRPPIGGGGFFLLRRGGALGVYPPLLRGGWGSGLPRNPARKNSPQQRKIAVAGPPPFV